MYILLCSCMLYNLAVGYTSSSLFVLYLSSAYVSPPLRHCYIFVCINLVVNVISMVTAICLCTSYNMLLGCATSWALCHARFLYIIGYSVVVILVDLNSQKWIDILLFELVVTCMEAHIFVNSFSISYIFIYIIKFFYCFLILGKLFNWNIQPYTTLIQHQLYTNFEQTLIFYVVSLATRGSNAWY